jgi:flagellar assembly protein FliH
MSSSTDYEGAFALPIAALEYRDIAGHLLADGTIAPEGGRKRRAEVELSEEEFAEAINRERAEATQQAEQRLRQEYDAKLQLARGPIAASLAAFQNERAEYYARVEAEVVQLALSIAAKILHRESQVDPMLVATLVRMAIDKMREGSSVTIRVGSRQAAKWKQHFGAQLNGHRVSIVEDDTLSDQDCVLETELGTANFGLDSQLKEVEKGFFDLLALRPSK